LTSPSIVCSPELAEPTVLRSINGPVDGVVPAERSITVRDLLTFQAGHSFPPDFEAPVVKLATCKPSPTNPFLQGQGWGFGGSVDLHRTEAWHVPGRYGWVGGTGTAAYVTPWTGTIAVWLT